MALNYPSLSALHCMDGRPVLHFDCLRGRKVILKLFYSRLMASLSGFSSQELPIPEHYVFLKLLLHKCTRDRDTFPTGNQGHLSGFSDRLPTQQAATGRMNAIIDKIKLCML